LPEHQQNGLTPIDDGMLRVWYWIGGIAGIGREGRKERRVGKKRLTTTTTRRTSLLAKTRFNPAKGVVAVGADFGGVDAAHAPVDCFVRFVSMPSKLGGRRVGDGASGGLHFRRVPELIFSPVIETVSG
jgi:hypothetical protein